MDWYTQLSIHWYEGRHFRSKETPYISKISKPIDKGIITAWIMPLLLWWTLFRPHERIMDSSTASEYALSSKPFYKSNKWRQESYRKVNKWRSYLFEHKNRSVDNIYTQHKENKSANISHVPVLIQVWKYNTKPRILGSGMGTCKHPLWHDSCKASDLLIPVSFPKSIALNGSPPVPKDGVILLMNAPII